MSDAAFWDGIAEDYAEKPVDDVAAWERKKAYLKERLTGNEVVLDIGCGTGSLAIELAPCAAHAHALDLSPAMVAIGERKMLAAGLENVTFHTGMFSDLDALEPGSVDLLCAFSILHLVPDHCAALAHIHRLLKPGGRFVSSTVCLGNSWMPYGVLLWGMRLLGKAPRVTILSTEQLLDDLRAAGFADVEPVQVGAQSTIAFLSATRS